MRAKFDKGKIELDSRNLKFNVASLEFNVVDLEGERRKIESHVMQLNQC